MLDGAVDGLGALRRRRRRPADHARSTRSPREPGCSTRRAPPADRRASSSPSPIAPCTRSTRSSPYKSPIANGPDDVYLSPAPLYHTAPVVTCSLAHRTGGTTVVMERWDPEACLAAIERYRVTSAQFVPTMFVRLLKLPPEVRAKLRRLVAAARHPRRGAVPGGDQAADDGRGSARSSGSTTPAPRTWAPRSSARRNGSPTPAPSGCPRFTTVHICDDDHVELPVGEVGNIWFDTPRRRLRVPRRPGQDRLRPQPGRLVQPRRRRLPRRRGLPVPDRPAVVHDHLRRA